MSSAWTCSGCRAMNDPAQRVCEMCGEERVGAAYVSAPRELPAYREFPTRARPASRPDDPCEECGRPVREHIEEAKRIQGTAEWQAKYGSQR